MDEGRDNNESAEGESQNNSTLESLNSTFTLDKPTLGVTNTPKLTLPIRVRVGASAKSSARDNSVLTKTNRTPNGSRRHAPYFGESARSAKLKHGGSASSFSPTCFSERVDRTKKQVPSFLNSNTALKCTRPLDLTSLYMQQLSPDSQRDQSASAKLLNASNVSPFARRITVPLSARYDVHTLQNSDSTANQPIGNAACISNSSNAAGDNSVLPFDTVHHDQHQHCSNSNNVASYLNSSTSANATNFDDAAARKQLIHEFSLADELEREQETQICAQENDNEHDRDKVGMDKEKKSAEVASPRIEGVCSSMPDLIASTIMKDTVDGEKYESAAKRLFDAPCESTGIKGLEAAKDKDGGPKYALLSLNSVRNDIVVARASSFEHRSPRLDALDTIRGPVRVLNSMDRCVMSGVTADECAPRAAKLKKFGSGDQLASRARLDASVGGKAKRSGSACDTADSNTPSQMSMSTTSSQSTVDSVENMCGNRPVRFSPFPASSPCHENVEVRSFRPNPVGLPCESRRPPINVNANVRQLTAELSDAAMMSFDEEIMEHFGNAQRSSSMSYGFGIGRTGSPMRNGGSAAAASPLRNNSMNGGPLRGGLENVRLIPLAMENGFSHMSHCEGTLCASPVSAGRSAYFPAAFERCTNPVSNVLEYGDETHFVPVSSREDYLA